MTVNLTYCCGVAVVTFPNDELILLVIPISNFTVNKSIILDWI